MHRKRAKPMGCFSGTMTLCAVNGICYNGRSLTWIPAEEWKIRTYLCYVPEFIPSLKNMFVTELKWLKFRQRGNTLWLTMQGKLILSTCGRNEKMHTGCQLPSRHGALSQPRFSWVPWKGDLPFQDHRSGGCRRRGHGVGQSGWHAKMCST